MAEYRAHDWLNTKTMKPVYSIQARVGKKGWAHVHENGKPMFFDCKDKRDNILKEMNQ
jgi:hypothetical protein